MATPTVSDLRLKFAEKPWNETFKLVRRCMDRAAAPRSVRAEMSLPRNCSIVSEPLVRCLKTLQEASTVSSLNTTKSRLEMIARQQGMGFHATDAACFLTADLFYLEVALLPRGGVEDAKVASHGRSPARSETLLQLLRLNKFTEFSAKLADLFALYDIPGDNEIKLKLLESLQCLEEDLQQISNLPREPKDPDPRVDTINIGRVGLLIAREADSPLTIQFHISPADAADSHVTDAVVQAAQVTLGVSAVAHGLPVASSLPRPARLDPRGRPVFLRPSEAPHETLPACFLLKLQPAMPMTAAFVDKIGQITGVTVPGADLQWAPFPDLLVARPRRPRGLEETTDEPDAVFTATLPGGATHSYVLPRRAWGAAAHRGAVVDAIPFTRPAHVPALVELLRRRRVLNALLASCLASPPGGAACDLHHEVLPEAEAGFSVTFRRPDADSLAVLLVNVSDAHHIGCTLFGAGSGDPSTNDFLSAVLTRSMSVPATLMALRRKLTPPPPPPPESDRLGPWSGALAAFARGASVPSGEEFSGRPGSARFAVSVTEPELHPEINTSPVVDLYPLPPRRRVSLLAD